MSDTASTRLREENRKWGRRFISLDITGTTNDTPNSLLIAAWRNKDWLAQLFYERGHHRLTVCRAALAPNRQRWADGITWDELMMVKRCVGYEHRWAVEIYPPDEHIINVANMRHLWLIEEPPYGWKRAIVEWRRP